ncbi:bifunctional glutamate--cysteine ligase GshA/glutathione synthetase GshB [Latilactobacillus graminis]|uniref:Glutathione biosynthesis bifunctional protein GshAB n=2 Tax=Latilactobacillus graminis TaxID=60519 RepID=A0AA89L4R1_9LACO|nr:bifunctional glutamate--cysteine ligase GshA/glutathione synthetase GshB [Latilactobacillus graminis]KRM22297.1 glutamate--cysteine ligase gamma-glutamylcysteine synthetase [Latilactobacillus graminis DSM 20719]QFP79527.1 bifunctional glutamate--cysteine ligase GshA/glutathione synthetase GshB [Latilactobacillus graminis]
MSNQLFENIKALHLVPLLNQGVFGIEKEGQRVTESGTLSQQPHPRQLGSRTFHPYITTDFAEMQTELVTDTFDQTSDVHQQLLALEQVLQASMETSEYIWPLSMPPILPADEQAIPISAYSVDVKDYRDYLTQRYGRRLQMVSGVHYNFSLSPTLLVRLFDEHYHNDFVNLKDFSDALYMHIAQNYIRYHYVLTYLFGASPIAETGFLADMQQLPEHPVRSLRASEWFGYRNKQLSIQFDSVAHYVDSMHQAITKGSLISEREYYGAVRLRSHSLDEMLSTGVDYLEFRGFDINPYTETGIDQQQLDFLHLFFTYLLSLPQLAGDLPAQINTGNQLNNAIALEDPTQPSQFQAQLKTFMADLAQFMTDYQLDARFKQAWAAMNTRVQDYQQTLSYQLVSEIKDGSLTTFAMKQARQFKRQLTEKPFQLQGYTDMELSTQMVMFDAFQKGLHVAVLDRSDQFIELTHQQHHELVKNGNMTSLDRLISWPLVDNKVVTKIVLANQGIRVPAGAEYTDLAVAKRDYQAAFGQRAIVIKPKTSNMGAGITTFLTRPSEIDFVTAFKLAQQYDQQVLVEEYIAGSEYRFLVMDHQVQAVLERVPANVVGDGHATITQLVAKKNRNELRGEDHRTPLQNIRLGAREQLILKQQGYQIDDVPMRGSQVFLLQNSNISNGGDSVDVTDEIDQSYFAIAEKVAAILNLSVAGIDIIIPNLYQSYDVKHPEMAVVLEANYNPAMLMHLFPMMGKQRRVTIKMLAMLFPELEIETNS